MGKIDELAKRLEEQQKKALQDKVEIEKAKIEWVSSIKNLFDQIKIWISPLIQKKLVKVNDSTIQLNEEYTGLYSISSLTIQGSNWTMNVTPVARFIIGGQGRVDITCGAKSVMIILHKNGWELALKRDRGFEYEPFNEELFVDLIDELTT